MIAIQWYGKYTFVKYKPTLKKYYIESSNYERIIRNINKSIKNQFEENENEKSNIALINFNKDRNNKMRHNPLLIAVQIMELLDIVTYSIEAGNKPEFFVRVNSDSLVNMVLKEKEYRSRTIDTIYSLHNESVKCMRYFFERLETNDERWQFIEDYFLGIVNEKYNLNDFETKYKSKKVDEEVKKSLKNKEKEILEKEINDNTIKIYTLSDNEIKDSQKYYVSDDNIEEFDNKGLLKITVNSELGKKLINCKQTDIISTNNYEYLVEKIEIHEFNN